MKRSKHITLDDLPPAYRKQAEAQLKVIDHREDDLRETMRVGRDIISRSTTPQPAPARTRERKPRAPNKTEQLFNREMLGGLGRYEAVTLKLPGNSRYTPDYLTSVFDPQEQQYETTVYEVKGTYKLGSHGRALTAFREARAAFPFLTFKWYERQKGGGWLERYKQ